MKEFFIADHLIADLEIKIEIRVKMMMVGCLFRRKSHLHLGGNYELKVARYCSLNSLSYWL